MRPYPIIISFLDFALLSLSFLPRGVTIASHTRIAFRAHEDDDDTDDACVCSSRYASSFLRSSRAIRNSYPKSRTARERFRVFLFSLFFLG